MRTADASLLIIALVIAWSVYRAHNDDTSTFNLLDLLMENGRLSRLACAFMTTLVVTSWIMVRLSFDGKMTDAYFLAYGGIWVTPIIARLFSPPPPAPVPGVITVTDTTTHEKKTEKKPK